MKNLNSTAAHENNMTISYIVGFIFSIVLTLVAYLIVVNKTVSGTTLLMTILALAVLQMLVQIFFFLHLGRGPKPLYNIVFFVGTVGLILMTVLGSIFIIDNLHYNMSPSDTTKRLAQDESIYQVGGEKTGACQTTRINHKVTIKDGVVSPNHISASLCDTLTFINKDEKAREIAFGSHPAHGVYGGLDEVPVPKGYNKTITLNQLGTYSFHDHLDPDVSGSFEVNL